MTDRHRAAPPRRVSLHTSSSVTMVRIRQRSSPTNTEEHEESLALLAEGDDDTSKEHGGIWKSHIWLMITGLFMIAILAFHSSSLITTTTFSNSSSKQPTIAPHWQSIVADTGITYPLMSNGDTRSDWILYSTDGAYEDIKIKGTPGDIITDLMNANILDEPYLDLNFLTQRHVWTGNVTDYFRGRPQLEYRSRTWNYETTFSLPNNNKNHTFVLVVEGIKMGASLTLNGVQLGQVTDQFLRYDYVIGEDVLQKAPDNNKHKLVVSFDPTISTDGRFMGCSGGWDWAPYIPVGDERGSRSYTFGIFKPLYVVAVESVYISQVVPKVYYTGAYPMKPMSEGAEADFRVSIQVHVVSPKHPTSSGALSLVLKSEFGDKIMPLPAIQADTDTVISINVTVPREKVKLWWPNGMGSQRLYPLSVALERQGTKSSCIQKRIGFRHAALVTIDDSNTTLVDSLKDAEGSGEHGMYFRVNGALVWARGGNFVPMDQLEGRMTDEAHKEAVRSAAAANMNMLRIWGGGMVLPGAFYDACDEEGILIFHDMMFVQEKHHGPVQTPTGTEEIRHLIRSLASHTSIVLWNGCNECSSLSVFASYVMRLVAEEDDTRSIWPSSPSTGGWQTGVRTLDSRPNGKPLQVKRGRRALEVHGPYGHSFSEKFPSVNSVPR